MELVNGVGMTSLIYDMEFIKAMFETTNQISWFTIINID